MKVKPPTVFWGNERVSHEAIIEVQRAETLLRLKAEEKVLLVQDTTSFNFSHHPATKGMGHLENEYTQGFLAHTTLAVSQQGVPLGVLAQQVWARLAEEKGKRKRRHELPFEEKESYKWVRGLARTGEKQPTHEITICDREGHIYEFLYEAVEAGMEFIVRASAGRGFTSKDEDVIKVLGEQAAQATYSLSLKRHPEREAREAQVELRFTSLWLKRPARVRVGDEGLSVQVVEVVEPHPPQGEAAVRWVLLTTLAVQTIQQAQEVVRFYSYRWLIERLHYVLKSGCKLEESQLREEKRLERLLGIYTLVAWKLLWLTYQARQTPEVPCTHALQVHEWQALYAFIQRTHIMPQEPPSLRQAVRWIAQLGGFLGRKGDGEPGVKVLWRGWTRLQDISDAWILFNPSLPKDVGNA